MKNSNHFEAPAIKYDGNSESNRFIQILKQRIDAYFDQNHISKYGNQAVYFKMALILAVFLGSYALMLSNRFSPPVVFLFAVICGLSNVLIVMNIAHDASHHALSSNKKINRLLSWTLELSGLSHYLWQINHNIIHHPYPNVAPVDSEITIAIPFIRFTTFFKKSRIQRFQHLYTPFLYLFFTMNLILLRDFSDVKLLPKKNSQQVVKRFSPGFYLVFFLSKIFYFGFALVIPLLILDIVWWKVIIGFFAVHAIMSIFELCIQLPLHINENSPITEIQKEGRIPTNYAVQMLKSTTDYAPMSRMANFITGGINTHTVHHFFPGICHIHYIALTRILKSTAREFDMPYQSMSWAEGMQSHFRRLKELALAA